MLIRNCAGGLVFNGDSVLILKNDKGEWVFPKGKILEGEITTEAATRKVEDETGVQAEIVSLAGDTAYEFYSVSREEPVCNKIVWFVMESDDRVYQINTDQGFRDGGFFHIEDALKLITYSQDRSLLTLSHQKYVALKQEEYELIK